MQQDLFALVYHRGKGPCPSRKYSDTFKAIAAFIAVPLERNLQLRLNRLQRSNKRIYSTRSEGTAELAELKVEGVIQMEGLYVW
jgi:hypothetical protein